MEDDDHPYEESVEIPLDGILDLHTFRPADVRQLVEEYVSECAKRDIRHLRIIHGKGRGHLRRIVHSVLGGLREVQSFTTAGEEEGGWGATLVVLKKK
jgi:DNA-nicking Smr family endonuclease